MTALKLIAVGNSVGVVFPKDILAKLGAEKGDLIHVTEAPGGGVRLSVYSEEVAEEVRLGEAFMDRYKNTFRALAK